MTRPNGGKRRRAGATVVTGGGLVDPMGDLFDQLGISRVAGRLFGFLLTCDPPERAASELAAAVGASTGSVNTMLRLLIGLGLVSRTGVARSRRYLYRVHPEAWSGLLLARLRLVDRLRALAALGLEQVGRSPRRRDRLEAMHDFYTFFSSEMSSLIERYLAQQEKNLRRRGGRSLT